MQTEQNKPAASGRNTFQLSASDLPPGVADKLQPGDKLQLECTSAADDSGMVGMTCCEEESPEEDQNETMEEGDENSGNWEESARAALSPQAPENEA